MFVLCGLILHISCLQCLSCRDTVEVDPDEDDMASLSSEYEGESDGGGGGGPSLRSEAGDREPTSPSLSWSPATSHSVVLTKIDTVTTTESSCSGTNEEQRIPVLIVKLKGSFTTERRFKTRVEHAILKGNWTPRVIQRRLNLWTHMADSALLDFINSQSTPLTSLFSKSSQGTFIKFPHKLLSSSESGMCLSGLNLLDLQARAMILESFNTSLAELLPLINVGNSDPRSLGCMLRQCGRYIFTEVKEPLLMKTISATSAPSGGGVPAHLNLDNFKAANSLVEKNVDITTSQCCFAQSFRALGSKDAAVFRHVFSSDRVFQINFEGESGIDAGGVFREGVSRMVEDLFSENFNLLQLCPNGIHGVHVNTDKYIPNTVHTSALSIEMFEYVGRLIGMSIRVKLCLPFEFPSLMWKKILGEVVDVEDLTAIDFLAVKQLNLIAKCVEDGVVDQELFSDMFGDDIRFVYTKSDGIEVELCRGGRDIIVTFDNRQEFYDKMVTMRLSEFDKQCEALARGLDQVLPLRVLYLFSWEQLDVLASGSPTFDIELWKSKTESSSLSAHVVALFWKVMESLTPKEQSGWVRFAWGRARLPPKKDFTTTMKLTSLGSSSTRALPLAHTCFFSVEMPNYTTEADMRHGLLTAIHYGCCGILNS